MLFVPRLVAYLKKFTCFFLANIKADASKAYLIWILFFEMHSYMYGIGQI